MKKWDFDTKDRKAYLALLGEERLKGLRPEPFLSDPVSYGRLTHHFEAPHD